MNSEIENLSIATIRSLCIDVVNKAKSGHPGMPLGSAPILYTLYTKHLVADPTHPNWQNRDRFVLSAGHASSLLYSMLHLCGYKVTMDDLKSFRQLNSKTPGHPEYGWTEGVDATTGPLGQGLAQAVGMAVAETQLAAIYTDGDKLFNHYTYALCGDGCLEEGISQETISFAGLQKLNKLIFIYDANNVTLDGKLDLSNIECQKQRFLASNWNVLEVEDGNDVNQIDNAIKQAKKSKDKPTLIIVHTIIGYGSVNQGTNKVHGNPLGEEDGHHAKVDVYHFDHEDFYVGEEVYKHFQDTFIARGVKAFNEYDEFLKAYAEKNKAEYKRYVTLVSGDVSSYLPHELPEITTEKLATRKASQNALQVLALKLPNLFGGCADVASSVMTKIEGITSYDPTNRGGHNMNFGIREFAMGAIANGMLAHGGVRTYVGCFLAFADYMKPAIRMAALSHLPSIYLFSHDSIAVGEDGPTHQPIEQVAMLRSIPNLVVLRPCDEKETFAAWISALARTDGPTAIILSRQGLPLLANTSLDGVKKGAYIVYKEHKKAQVEIVATGSEVALAIDASKILFDEGIDARVISMPSWENFEKQDDEYKKSVLSLDKSHRVSIEMLTTFGWARYADLNIGIDTFGKSAPDKHVIPDFGFTSVLVAQKIKNFIK